jgi:TonB family protein
VLYAAAGIGVALGAVGLLVGLRSGNHGDTQAAVTPPPAPAAAVPPPPPPRQEPRKVAVQIDTDTKGARVVFRRRLSAAPMTAEITPSDIVEMVEVSAPGYKTERYWLTFDRETRLKAHLTKGNGIDEASEEATLVALGEVSAPAAAAAAAAAPAAPAPAPTHTETVAAKPKETPAAAAATATVAKADSPPSQPKNVEVASSQQASVMARRKIGRAAASSVEAPPDTTLAVETVQRPRGAGGKENIAAMEPTPSPVAVSPIAAPPGAKDAPKTAPTTAKVETQPAPEPTWAKPAETPAIAKAEPAAATQQPAKAAAMPATVLPPSTLKTLLISGGTIAPPDIVQNQMMREEKKKTSAVLKVCIGQGGEVTSSAIAKSSGYPEYDAKLVSGVKGWRYRPYMVNGQYVPVCSAVAFAFSIQ